MVVILHIECLCGVGDTLVHVFLVGVIARSKLLASARDVYWLNRTWYFAFTSLSVAFNAAIFSLVRPILSAMDVNSLHRNHAETTEVQQNVKRRRPEGPPPQLELKDSSGETAASSEPSVSSTPCPPPQLDIKDTSETTEVQQNVKRWRLEGPPPQLDLKDSSGETTASSEPCVSSTSWPSRPPPQLGIKDSSETTEVQQNVKWRRLQGPPPQLDLKDSSGETAVSSEPEQQQQQQQTRFRSAQSRTTGDAEEASTDSDRSNHSSVDSFMYETVHEDHRRQSEMRSDIASDASARSLSDDDSSVQVSCYSLAGDLLHTVIVSPDASIGQLKARLRKSTIPMRDVEPTSFIIEDVKFDWADDNMKFMLTGRCRGKKKLHMNFVWETQGTS